MMDSVCGGRHFTLFVLISDHSFRFRKVYHKSYLLEHLVKNVDAMFEIIQYPNYECHQH